MRTRLSSTKASVAPDADCSCQTGFTAIQDAPLAASGTYPPCAESPMKRWYACNPVALAATPSRDACNSASVRTLFQMRNSHSEPENGTGESFAASTISGRITFKVFEMATLENNPR